MPSGVAVAKVTKMADRMVKRILAVSWLSW